MGQPWLSRRFLTLACLVAGASASTTRAHEAGAQASGELWTAWIWEPGVVFGLTLSAWLYVRGVQGLWYTSTAGGGIGRWEVVAFGGGWLVLGVALLSPLHALGGLLFSAHMLQHVLLMLIAAPLLVLGRPHMPFLWGLPSLGRRGVGKLGVTEAETRDIAGYLYTLR